MEQSLAEYRKTASGDGWTFQVDPASAVRRKFFAFVGYGIVGVLVLITLGSGSLGTGVVFAIFFGPFAALLIWAGRRDWRPKEHRTASQFRVSRNAIELQGRTIVKDDIHRLIVRGRDRFQSSVVTVAGQKGATASAFAQLYNHREDQVSHGLSVEAGGKAYSLAGGMDETTAFGLYKEVTGILGLAGT